jgi:hypothetical protein
MVVEYIFRTGEIVKNSGIYKSPVHADGSRCDARDGEQTAHLQVGQRFPCHQACQSEVYWLLFDNEDRPE